MRIFLTHIAQKDKILEYNLSIAAANFSYNLIESGLFEHVYFILPTFIKGEIESFKGLIYSSLRLRRYMKPLAPIIENILLFFKIPKKSSIWYYNCTILNAPLIVLLKLFKPDIKQNIIILDYTPSHKITSRFFLWLTNKMDGSIRLANSSLFTLKNSVCLPGVTPFNAPQYPQIVSLKKEFLISGVLTENISMLSMLLEAFSKMPDMKLHITGKLHNLEGVDRYTRKNKNIIYHGMVKYEEYLRILHDITFVLSTRNPDSPENLCNFPSKIMEALLHNRIIISTLHYEQLHNIYYFEVSVETTNFINDLRRITTLPSNELLCYANQADEIKKRFNTEVWRECMDKIENYGSQTK